MPDPTFPITTNGSDRTHGGYPCCAIHDGDVSGPDVSCCCCDPCSQATMPAIIAQYCCKCVPSTVCFYFQLDEGNSECCRSFGIFAMAEIGAGNVQYTADFREFTVILLLEKTDVNDLESPCVWRLTCDALYINETVEIDHVTEKCIEVPAFVIEGVSFDSGCTGSIGITASPPAKIAYRNTNPEVLPDVAIPHSPCDSILAAKELCVGGVRHVGDGTPEYVTFTWNEDMGDRWEYLPCDGNPTTDREVIYARGDGAGNCYLELDFEQSGGDTNDWNVPPNSYDENYPNEIRDGMIAVDTLGCGIRAQSTLADGRYVRIHSGPCYRYKYLCGSCRCVPETLCVLVYRDQAMHSASAVWDGESGWDCYDLDIRFELGPDACDDCVVEAIGDFLNQPEPSSPVNCGNFLAFENSSVFDPAQPLENNFIFASGTICGCTPTSACGICPQRCGGPPDTLYVTAVYGIREDPSFPYIEGFECTWSATVMYWQRVIGLVTFCGYIGWTTYTCEGTTYLVRVEIQGVGGTLSVTNTYYSLVTGAIVTTEEVDLPLSDCEPYAASYEENPSPGAGPYFQFSVVE